MRKLPNDSGKKGYRVPVYKAYEEFSRDYEEYSRIDGRALGAAHWRDGLRAPRTLVKFRTPGISKIDVWIFVHRLPVVSNLCGDALYPEEQRRHGSQP